MVLIIDLLAILFIVSLSYILSMYVETSDIKNNTLLSHIVIGLSVIVFYKLVRYFKLTDKLKTIISTKINESFDSNNSNNIISDFISNTNSSIINSQQVNTLTPIEFANYTKKIDSLINSITDLKTQLNTPSTENTLLPANMNSMDLSAQQEYQMFQINFLQNQIKNAQDVINASTIEKASVNYKPIKVFSSCVVSNANGTNTIELPVETKTSSKYGGLNNISPFVDSNASKHIINTISQTNNQTNGPALNLSPNTGILGSLLDNTIKTGNINIS